jgi:hypothetical protein
MALDGSTTHVSGTRIVWIDFDVATTFKDMRAREKAYCEYEVELVKSSGKVCLCPITPNTKYY